MTDFDAMASANLATLQRWVSEASAGFLTVEKFPGHSFGFTISRQDGQPMDGKKVHGFGDDRPITGVGVRIDFSRVRKMDRRWKVAMRDVRNAVRTVLVGYVADPPMETWGALSMFEYRNKIGD